MTRKKDFTATGPELAALLNESVDKTLKLNEYEAMMMAIANAIRVRPPDILAETVWKIIDGTTLRIKLIEEDAECRNG
jgi:hypothetical protein